MQNAALARLFDEIADYLELAGDNPFKIRAYRRASEAVLNYPEPIEDALETGDIENIEGLGQATVAKTREFLATGTIRLLDHLKNQYPAGLLEVLRVPGLGSKKVALLYKELGIDSLESFVAALEAGKLVGVAGFGPKTIENLKTGVRRMAEMTSRLPISHATELAAKILASLQKKLPDTEIEIAGSLRRGVDTVGNINFVAKSDDVAAVQSAFDSLPLVLEVTVPEPNRLIGRVPPGIEVEIVVSPPARFGSELFFRTGSRAHVENIAVEGDYADEAALYQALGAGYIPPELREGKGEWEAAKAHQLPKLLVETDIRGDLHSHSTWSDGIGTIRQMAEAMQARGYEYFAVTDHSKALAMANGLNAQRLREQAKEIAEVQADCPDLKILRGIECDIMRDGSMDLDDEILSELDIVIGSVHSAFNLPLEAQTERMIKAIQHPHVDLIGHPTGRVLGVRPPYDVDVNALIEAALEYNTALEINASERLDLKDEQAFVARERGVLLSIDTDAHSTKMLPNMSYGVAVARRAWCQQKDVLNAMSGAELLRWLHERRS